jgi:lipopolysaccharide transport protein LptA
MADLVQNVDRKRGACACGALLMLFAAHSGIAATATPTTPSLNAPLAWSADVLTSDFRSNTLDLDGNVRVTQGPMSIEAQKAKAREMKGDSGRWTFEKAVHIRSTEADLQSNLATAAIVNGQIADARVEGTPARFEQVGGTTNRQVRGRAGVIEYDFGTGVVKLTNQVWFSNGKDEFRGDVVIYNVRDERVQINPGGSSNRVRGIIRPNQDQGAKPRNSSGGAGTAEVIEEPEFETIDPRLATDGGGA